MTERSTGSRGSTGRKYNRRDFLKMGGAGLAGAALLGAAGCGGGGGGSGDLIFSMGPDDEQGTMATLIKRFNEQSDFKVTHRVMPSDTGQYFDKLRTQFQAQAGGIDVIGGDVIWPAQLAANGWILDISDKFPESEQGKFLDGPMQSVTYEGRAEEVSRRSHAVSFLRG
jgi:multiple sugar transport system substrate-binding protein